MRNECLNPHQNVQIILKNGQTNLRQWTNYLGGYTTPRFTLLGIVKLPRANSQTTPSATTKKACNENRYRPLFMYGADGETRTLTAEATAPSRLRVYQFHHIRKNSFTRVYR